MDPVTVVGVFLVGIAAGGFVWDLILRRQIQEIKEGYREAKKICDELISDLQKCAKENQIEEDNNG